MGISDFSTNIYGVPLEGTGTTIKRGYYKVIINGKYKSGSPANFSYNITGSKQDFKEPFFEISEAGDTTNHNDGGNRKASGTVSAGGGGDKKYFIPDSKILHNLILRLMKILMFLL